MKKKLTFVLFLTTLLLTGIIALQAYWSFSAYKLNKEKFDGDINVAMLRALDSCKKDYFDSIRVVLVKRLSDPGTKIKLDTIRNQDTIHPLLSISIANKYMSMSQPFQTTLPTFDWYRKKIAHKATVPEVVTEMSFYVPQLLDMINMSLSFEDISSHSRELTAFLKAHSNEPRDSVMVHNKIIQSGTFAMPPNYRKADSIRLYHYYDQELHKMHRYADFSLKFSDKPIPADEFDPHHLKQLRYSETDEFIYKYHGFLFLQHTTKEQLFVRAVFDRAHVGVLKEMILALGASGIIIVFTIICLWYIIRTLIKQRKLSQLKDDFVNNMTHELKTPIATITVALEGLQKFDGLNDPDKTRRYLQTSRNELQRLDQLVSKVLNVAAFENKQVTINKEFIAVDELITQLIEEERQKTDKQIEISYTNVDSIKEIPADRVHFRNVMFNLIDNAIKYSTEPVIISISLRKEDTYAVFTVRDNGSGIPAGHLNRIFDKFHRVPSGSVHNVKGTGLGLSYVKYIVEAHGGHISVKSELNKGSQFTVTIPLKHG
ncbi:sensor histidine kinase [Mucilaginibacter terrenus]|nr:HAMP domain-containing sensor histidine kinase [Mucilaginibacter terrenus]